ncbi:hypothetical protein H6P81_003579 [Aristolochia fimbriata]|uniref:AB hydrolase-1 domain-containing protein n=1 Tax=Aristolochia fimbriata TaxID=158543 RepID=A0AAV7FG65_ARIFI|nr:hypothetical protein H6P81_003579 [Aristolochia fimbriata]
MARNLRNPPQLRYGFFSSQLLSYFRGNFRFLGTLAYEEIRVSEDKPYNATAFVLHGLLGTGRNWRTFSQNLASEISKSSSSTAEWRMVLVDLRNHGKSATVEALKPPHTIENSARDLGNLIKSQGWPWPDVVIGHSLGGKVALDFANSCAHGKYGVSATLPKQLWVLDSEPGEVCPEFSSGEVEKVLHTLQSLPSSLPSRRWVVEHMIGLGFSKAFSEWIGTNLKKENDHLTWSFNLEGAIEMFNSYRSTSYWSLLERPPQGVEISLVRAENSDRWSPPIVQRLESLANKGKECDEGKFSLHVLPNSGHWVQVDNPKGLLEVMTPKIASL